MSRRAIVISLIILAVLAAAAFLIYNWIPGLPMSRVQTRILDQQQQHWRSQNVSHYRMQVTIGCFCPFYDMMPLTVEVLNGEIVTVTDNKGRPVAADDPVRTLRDGDLLTADGIFDYARQALAEADVVTIEYDRALSYPTSVSVDWIKQAMDDEMSVQIVSLARLP